MFLHLYSSFSFMVLFYFLQCIHFLAALNGRYTKSIENFKLIVPHRLSSDGSFLSYEIPNYYKRRFAKRRKRSLSDPELVNYGIHLNDKKYHLDLWPNHNFLSPNVVFEKRDPNAPVQDRLLRTLDKKHLCHYTGNVRDHPDSKVALSTCNGLAGHISVDNTRYFIEPVQEHEPNENGQHLHVVYENKRPSMEQKENGCGTDSNIWREAWKKRFRESMTNKNQQSDINLQRRGLTSEHRYLETLIVCDKKFLEHHKHTDYELYVLTIMNMVADFYHDSSSGNQLDVVVVRVMYLEKEEQEIDLVINQDATATLASFCKWQEKINPKDIRNPNHHDIAVLLTRYDICADAKANCGLMGLAYVASACTGNEPCAINEDGGLVLGTVVAHEMGHVMGCAHDKEGESTCPAQDTDESFFVMAPFVHLYTTRWSTCSRAFITALFENNLGECLNDEPETTLYQLRNALPGTIYDADAQCNMAFPHSTVCLVPDVKFCETLLCRTSPDQCLSKDEPPADGTKCGENKWCFRKDCVEIGERPEAVNGGWSAWGSWSACSRTCGGGVAMAERNCNNPVPEHKGLYCMGDRKKVKICNLNACPEGVPSFRETQCTEHNNKPIGGKLTKWRVYFLKDEPCVLYCLSEENIYSKLEPRVKDGTRCKPGTKDMCIAGVCKHIGCDGEIDSTAVEDICGVCNGDGTKCKIIDEVYTDVGARDYKKIATIPAGSRNIRVEELGPSINTIAISDKTESGFYLNPEHTEELDGNKRIGKTEAVYTHPEPGKELLIMHGPLDDDMILFVVFYKMENVGYQYRYAEMTADLSYTPHYQWQMLEWSECTVRCGGGFQSPLYTCVEDKAGKVSPNFCAGIEKVNEQPKSCNEQPCKTRWKVGKWSECHACKSKSGVKMREVECVREAPVSGKEDVLVEDVECLDPRPGSRQLCNSHKTCKVRRRKLDDDLPDDLMQEVWMQTNHKSISTRRRDLQDLDDADLDDEVCGTTTTTTTCGTIGTEESSSIEGETEVATEKIHLDVGKIIKDKIPSEEIKLIRVPLKQTHLSYNLSDNAFETMGDSVGDSIDTGKAEEVTGDEAAKILKELQQNHQKAKGDKRKRKKRFRYTDKCNG